MPIYVAIAVWLMYYRVFLYLEFFSSFTYWIYLLKTVFLAIKYFFFVYFIILVMFGNAIYVLNTPRVYPWVLDADLDLSPDVFS